MTKTPFPELIKSMRKVLNPKFKAIATTQTTGASSADNLLQDIEDEYAKLTAAGGYTVDEFAEETKNYFIDFSSSNLDEWVVRLDPEHATIITPSSK